MNVFDTPHRRYNPLTREWLLVSPHRARRPWQGQVEKLPHEGLPAYDPDCYLCPGNSRSGGQRNPLYENTYTFDNDFPALLAPHAIEQHTGIYDLPAHLFRSEPVSGACRVMCFSPRHDLTLPELPQEAVELVVRSWIEQPLQMSSLDSIQYVQVFENKGAMMGCSNPHPHSQIWATSCLPVEPAKELASQSEYLEQHGSCLLCDVLTAEHQSGERLIAANEHFTALTPYWAIWPFEVLVIARRHAASLPELTPAEISGLADVMRQVTIRYDNLFEISFPYSMGFHQKPNGGDHPAWHLHAHYYPPLLRSATVRKFMVGYELMSMPQRDLTPENAAERLRALSGVHYKHK